MKQEPMIEAAKARPEDVLLLAQTATRIASEFEKVIEQIASEMEALCNTALETRLRDANMTGRGDSDTLQSLGAIDYAELARQYAMAAYHNRHNPDWNPLDPISYLPLPNADRTDAGESRPSRRATHEKPTGTKSATGFGHDIEQADGNR